MRQGPLPDPASSIMYMRLAAATATAKTTAAAATSAPSARTTAGAAASAAGAAAAPAGPAFHPAARAPHAHPAGEVSGPLSAAPSFGAG